MFLFLIDRDIAISNVGSMKECGNHCLGERKCLVVLYYSRERLCWLKHSIESRSISYGKDSMMVVNRDWYFLNI
jgi:hypothetical protein